MSGRGGNRLPSDHPNRVPPPRYQRRRVFDPDPDRRDRGHRERLLQAARADRDAGMMTAAEFDVLDALSRTWSDRTGKDCWPALTTIGAAVGRAERTAQRHISRLRELGYVERCHRSKLEAGRWIAQSAITRLHTPTRRRDTVEQRQDHARANTNTEARTRGPVPSPTQVAVALAVAAHMSPPGPPPDAPPAPQPARRARELRRLLTKHPQAPP